MLGIDLEPLLSPASPLRPSLSPSPPANLRPSYPPGYSQSDGLIVRASNAANGTSHLQELQPGQEGREASGPLQRAGWARGLGDVGGRDGGGRRGPVRVPGVVFPVVGQRESSAWWTNFVLMDARSYTTLART
ncbi:hypothetical protein C2845_PM04G09530 [Panicum miliaceum]|uniref:Uncharacterized protein n=1 Tax=Panicum miliaceum TaxID=4540 RepID=A0A3L6QN32_PANMI|nr:hypothetical protein C2845_PM04G09530 [Panicum miliaceum]